jgi:hypothetical protein
MRVHPFFAGSEFVTSETVLVTDGTAERLTHTPRRLLAGPET